jgi:hypothetical protein
MIRHIWSVLCSKVAIDRSSNNISLFEVIEAAQLISTVEINFPANVPYDGTFVTLWAREQPNVPTTVQARMRFLAPTGQELIVHQSPIDLQATSRSRHIVNLNGLRVGGPGIHEFEVSWRQNDQDDWHRVASIPVDLSFAVQPEQPAAAPQ